MKLAIFGAAGRVGSHLVEEALAQGHEVTAFVRRRDALGAPAANVTVVEGDAADEAAVAAAMAGQQVAINAAGSPRDVQAFHAICKNVILQAENNLAEDDQGRKRLWLLGGVAALDVPQLGIMGVDCPGVPDIYKVHKKNYEVLTAVGDSLDWTMICPGPIVAQAVDPQQQLIVTVDVMPYSTWGWLRIMPRSLHSIIMAARLSKLAVSYADVARIIMQNLESGGPYSKKRIGLALRPK